MRKFFRKSFVSICILVLFFELFVGTTSPVFSLRQFYSEVKKIKNNFNKPLNLNNDKIYNLDGELIKLRINNIGFLSHSDFYADSLYNKIAIIGDSFVESKVCGTDNSIAFYLEKKTNYEVYNFGVGGWNINDYYSIYDEYELEKAKTVFIMITGIDDISWKNIQTDIKKTKSKLINHFKTRLFNNNKQLPDYSLLKNNYENVVFILHDNILEESLKNQNISNKIIQINSLNKDYRYSDGHYNEKGNNFIANSLVEFITH